MSHMMRSYWREYTSFCNLFIYFLLESISIHSPLSPVIFHCLSKHISTWKIRSRKEHGKNDWVTTEGTLQREEKKFRSKFGKHHFPIKSFPSLVFSCFGASQERVLSEMVTTGKAKKKNLKLACTSITKAIRGLLISLKFLNVA